MIYVETSRTKITLSYITLHSTPLQRLVFEIVLNYIDYCRGRQNQDNDSNICHGSYDGCPVSLNNPFCPPAQKI